MPVDFIASFGEKIVVIIDCFEIFKERPSKLWFARAATWSSYKHHNTVKYLIVICPQGTNFHSKGWVGRTSDKHVTVHCGISNNLLPGDVLLADRGVDISESVAVNQANLHLKALTKGKSQLSPLDVKELEILLMFVSTWSVLLEL